MGGGDQNTALNHRPEGSRNALAGVLLRRLWARGTAAAEGGQLLPPTTAPRPSRASGAAPPADSPRRCRQVPTNLAGRCLPVMATSFVIPDQTDKPAGEGGLSHSPTRLRPGCLPGAARWRRQGLCGCASSAQTDPPPYICMQLPPRLIPHQNVPLVHYWPHWSSNVHARLTPSQVSPTRRVRGPSARWLLLLRPSHEL